MSLARLDAKKDSLSVVKPSTEGSDGESRDENRRPHGSASALMTDAKKFGEPTAKSSTRRPTVQVTKSTLYFALLTLSVLVPAAAMSTWLVTVRHQPELFKFNTFAGSVIGGRLSQTQAKVIDFVCSAVLAPLLVAHLNMVWFSIARVCVINEKERRRQGVPLATLATASRMGGGSYNFYDYLALLRGRTWRLLLLVMITFCSAISSSTLSNIIAYEAYSANVTAPDNVYNLRGLRNLTVEHPWGFNHFSQNSTLLGQASLEIGTMLNALLSEDASSSLDAEGGYVGPNATSASMASIPLTVVEILNVPGYRLTADCQPAVASSFDISHDQAWGTAVAMQGSWALANDSEKASNYTYYFIGTPSDTLDASQYGQFTAFSEDSMDTILGYYWAHIWEFPDNEGDDTDPSWPGLMIPSAYGDIHPAYVHSTSSASNYSNALFLWSVHCSLFQQDGLLNYTRSSNQDWLITASDFAELKTKTRPTISDWQVDSSYQPSSQSTGFRIPGIAGAISGSAYVACSARMAYLRTDTSCDVSQVTNMSTFVNNFVFASGEARRTEYNVIEAAPGGDLDTYDVRWYAPAPNGAGFLRGYHDPPLYFRVAGAETREYYRITYVPVLLLAGLLGVLLAALLTAAMVVHAGKTRSWRTFRQVDVLRLLADSSAATPRQAPELARVSRLSDDELLRWAREYRVAYLEDVDEDGGRTVLLVKGEGKGSRKTKPKMGVDGLPRYRGGIGKPQGETVHT